MRFSLHRYIKSRHPSTVVYTSPFCLSTLQEQTNLNLGLSLSVLGNLHSLLGQSHISSESAVWDPLARVSWRCLLEHAINLLKRQSLGLGDEEVRVDEAGKAEGSPDEEDLGLEVRVLLTDHVGGDDGDDAVPEPVGGSRETDTTGADRDREDLTDDDPGSGTPGGGEEEDVDADKGDEGTDRALVVGEGGSDSADDELTDDHAESTPDEDGAATEALNGVEGDRGGDDVHDGEDHGHEEGVVDRAEGLEEDGRVVEDEVDTSPLLHHSREGLAQSSVADGRGEGLLERCSEDCATHVGRGLEEGTLEAVGPAGEVAVLGDNAHFIFVVGNNFSKLLLDIL